MDSEKPTQQPQPDQVDGNAQSDASSSNSKRPYLQRLGEAPWSVAVAGLVFAIVISIGAVGIFGNRSNEASLGGIELGGEFAARADEVGEVDQVIESGFSYAFGAPATDPTDYDSYQLPETPAELRAELIEALNTSPAFADIDHVNELLEYDDFDNDGNIKIDVVNSLLEIAEGAR